MPCRSNAEAPVSGTLAAVGRLLAQNPPALHAAYAQTLRLRGQLLGAIHAEALFGGAGAEAGGYIEDGGRARGSGTLAEQLTAGRVRDGAVTLTIFEALPGDKELTPALREHWVNLMQAAIAGAAGEDGALPYFRRAFAWVEVAAPQGANNRRLWDASNRAVNLVINNLKGAFFEDDDHSHLAFGVAGRLAGVGDGQGRTTVRVMDFEVMERVLAANP